MVRYERPSLPARCFFPLIRGMRRPFKPKIIRLVLAGLFWLLTFVWMILCGNISAWRMKDHYYQKELPDLFSKIPYHKVYPLPQVLLYILLTSAIGRMIFHKDGVAIARRFATIAGCAYIIRGLTLISTSLPTAQFECPTSLENELAFNFTDLCGDMMGHVVNVVLAALAWSQYTQYKIIKIFAWLTAMTTMILFLVNRSHYTLDIVVSTFISVFCWKYYHTTLRLPTNSQNQVVQWMEKLDGVAVGDVVERERETAPREAGISLTTVVTEALGTLGPDKYKELREDPPA